MVHNINQLVSHHAVVIKPLLYLTGDQAPGEVMEGKGKIDSGSDNILLIYNLYAV